MGALLTGSLLGATASIASASDWTRFLGPHGSSVAQDAKGLVEQWGDDENILWKADLPGRGVSSPIIVADKVFVTSYSGYGTGGENEKMDDLKRHLTCFDANSGSQLWTKTIDAVLPEDPYSPPGVTSHGYASHTPVSDGKNVFVFLGKSGVIAYDLDGNEKWRRSVGTGSGPQKWGSAASPILYQSGDKSLLIVTASEESESLVAFDTETGNEAWKSEAASLAGSWSTPNLAKSDEGTDLVLMVPGEVWGMNPETGKLRWYSRGTTDNTTSASPIVVGDIVYAIGGRGGESVAVRTGGSGDVNETHIVWDANIPGRFSSPIAYDGHIFVYSDGVISAYDAESGDRVGQRRLPSSSGSGGESGGRGGRRGGFGNIDYATPVIADGKLYIPTNQGECHIVSATPELDVIATNRLTDSTGFAASPAISDGKLYLRSGGALYCIGKQ
ncbi:hypothetical protein CGZ80_09390 [Rhodopirellula sp. MGV]|nr:hypothetical protein CGZ80_09390 [Rhodopirellula sp. MGV]PNY36678.1 serine/threonine protein kinase [Rhodopirellula baltica]